jgi:hypothetical protein
MFKGMVLKVEFGKEKNLKGRLWSLIVAQKLWALFTWGCVCGFA